MRENNINCAKHTLSKIYTRIYTRVYAYIPFKILTRRDETFKNLTVNGTVRTNGCYATEWEIKLQFGSHYLRVHLCDH